MWWVAVPVTVLLDLFFLDKGVMVYLKLYIVLGPLERKQNRPATFGRPLAEHCVHVFLHYSDVIMDTIASQITSLTIVYSTVYSKKTSKLPGEFPAQMASNAENVSIWWRHHVDDYLIHTVVH